MILPLTPTSAMPLAATARPGRAIVEISFPTVPTFAGLSPHGVAAALGVAIGLWLLVRSVLRRGLAREPVESAALWAIPAGIAGARLDYVVSHPTQFRSILNAFQIWQGGLALFGGLLAGIATAALVLHRHGAPVTQNFDAAAVPFAVAIAIGRTGDILLGDHLGRPVGTGWGLGFRVQAGSDLAPGFGPSPAAAPGPGESCGDLGSYYAGCTYHMSAAYDLLAAVAIAAVLAFATRRSRGYPGLQIAGFAYLYAGQRLTLDAVRGIDERVAFGLTGTQLLAIVIIGSAIVAFAQIARSARRDFQSRDLTEARFEANEPRSSPPAPG